MRYPQWKGSMSEQESCVERKTGPPAHSTDQRMRVLEILKDAGERGVYRELFLIPLDLGGYGVTQVSTRINVIDSKRVQPEDVFVTYFLRFAPEQLEELPEDKNLSADWYERSTGKKRPTGKSFGLLFDAVEETRR